MTYNKILFGDSRDIAHDVFPGLEKPIDCIVADPPYGVDYESNMATTTRGKEIVRKIEGDTSPEIAVAEFHEVMGALLPYLAPDADLYFFTSWVVIDRWMEAVRNIDPSITYNMLLIWEKGDPGMGDLESWGCGHELILYCKRGRRPRYGKRRPSVLHVDKVRPSAMIHPTEKPVPLIEMLLDVSTQRGDLVVDPYSGSGSTAVAAQRRGLNSISFERDEIYIPKSRDRLDAPAMMF